MSPVACGYRLVGLGRRQEPTGTYQVADTVLVLDLGSLSALAYDPRVSQRVVNGMHGQQRLTSTRWTDEDHAHGFGDGRFALASLQRVFEPFDSFFQLMILVLEVVELFIGNGGHDDGGG